jgi:hypothetical protein
MDAVATSFDASGLAERRWTGDRGLPGSARGPVLPDRARVEGARRKGARPLPGVLPRGIGPRVRDAAGEGAGRAGGDAPGRLALRLVPLFDPAQLARGGPRRPPAARPVRHPPDLRRGAEPGRGVGAQFCLPLPDPLSAPEREQRVRAPVPAGRVRAGAGGHRRRGTASPDGGRPPPLDRGLQREPPAHPGAVGDQARHPVAAGGG